jgi:hypothetical protein
MRRNRVVPIAGGRRTPGVAVVPPAGVRTVPAGVPPVPPPGAVGGGGAGRSGVVSAGRRTHEAAEGIPCASRRKSM